MLILRCFWGIFGMFLGCFLKIGPKYTLFLIVSLLIFNINKIKKGVKTPVPRYTVYMSGAAQMKVILVSPHRQ